MTPNGRSLTQLARIVQQQRALALKQQDSALLTGFFQPTDDDSHLDLTTRIRFLEACGGPPPYVLERVDPAGNVDRYMFERPFLIVGRSTACEVVCQDTSVSFRHVYLQYFKGTVWWFDLDSRSGVIADGQKRRAGCLRPGLSIRVGDYTLRLVEGPGNLPQGTPSTILAMGPTTLMVDQQPDLPKVRLDFINGKIMREGKPDWPIENSITLLGRRSCCDIRFAHESVSRVHASLVLTAEGLWVVDLLGRGGTKVNGVPSAYAYLHDGSLVEFGGYQMRVRYGERPQEHPAEAVLDEPEAPPRLSGGSGNGSVSEELLYQLVTNMAEMQKQMFDQNQMQITLLMQMMGSIHQSQQDLLRTELHRVHEISKEMQELQFRLGVKPGHASSNEPVPQPPPAKNSSAFAQQPGEAGDANDTLPAPRLFDEEADEHAPAPTEDSPRAKSNEVQDHAMLFQRMQNLDRERNSRLQKIFRAFRGSS